MWSPTFEIKKSELRKYKRLGYSTHWCIILYIFNEHYTLDKTIRRLAMIADTIVWVKEKNKYIVTLNI